MDSWNILCCKPQPYVSRTQHDNISWPQGGALFSTPGEEALNMGVAGRKKKQTNRKVERWENLLTVFDPCGRGQPETDLFEL